jgi:hypothetical protein
LIEAAGRNSIKIENHEIMKYHEIESFPINMADSSTPVKSPSRLSVSKMNVLMPNSPQGVRAVALHDLLEDKLSLSEALALSVHSPVASAAPHRTMTAEIKDSTPFDGLDATTLFSHPQGFTYDDVIMLPGTDHNYTGNCWNVRGIHPNIIICLRARSH